MGRYTDNRTKGRANTCRESGAFRKEGAAGFIRITRRRLVSFRHGFELNHGNKNGLRVVLARLRCTDGKSALSPVDGRIEAYRGDNG